MAEVFAKNYLGQIDVGEGGVIVVTDPCYLPDDPTNAPEKNSLHAAAYVTVGPNRKADVFATLADEGGWGIRVSELRLVFGKRFDYGLTESPVATVGVDSGQMSMMDADLIPKWGGDRPLVGTDWEAEFAKHRGEFNYPGVCDLTLSAAKGGVIGRMIAASSSGIGDGSYPVLVATAYDGSVNSVAVSFLDWDDEEEESDEVDDDS